MVDRKTLKIIKDLEMLRLVPNHLKTKKMCEHAVKKLSFIIRYVPDQYKTHKCVIQLF